MLAQVLDVFGIEPEADLALMRADQTLAGFTARAVESVDGFLSRERPELILVQGDTTTVFCAALAAFYQHIPVAHVEAGLRTGDLNAPWPEEANRVLTTRLASLHFAPTENARQNLLQEGVPERLITVTGNTVIDALLLALRKLRKKAVLIPGLPAALNDTHGSSDCIVLITGHRRESFGQGFKSICRAIRELARRFPDVHFIYPVHLNPNVRQPVLRILGARDCGCNTILTKSSFPNLHLIEPLSYLPFVALMARATVILTDSGAELEEAPSLGKPVLVMRDTTERPEAVKSGLVRLVGTVLGVSRTGSVADVGTGSGCIALSLAQEGAYSQVVGTDISAEALALAGVNRDRCAGRVSFVRGDLCGALRTGTFDALVSNPPYLTAEEYATLDPSVRDWEPRQALVGGTDGLETIARLLDEGRDVVRPGGWLALEVDCFRAAECAGLAGALGWTDVAVHTDLFGRERYLLARRSHTQ